VFNSLASFCLDAAPRLGTSWYWGVWRVVQLICLSEAVPQAAGSWVRLTASCVSSLT
jgi:hypothetical protein